MTKPSTLALVRHGESAWIVEGRFQGQGDPALSDVGRRQAAAVGARLATPAAMPSVPVPDHPPLAIWHSPLKRATETAEAIHAARKADARLHPLEGLMEVGQGEWEGLTHAEVRRRWPDELAAWREDPLDHHAPGGESLRDALLRVRTAGRAVLADADDGLEPAWTVIVAHDGVLRLLMMDLLGIDIEHFWSFPFTLASVTVLESAGGVTSLRAHNLDAHLTAIGQREARPPGAL